MNNYEDYRAGVDPIDLDKHDKANGALEVLPSSIGKKFVKSRAAGTTRDLLSQAQLKAGIAGLWRDGAGYEDIANRVSEEYGVNISKDTVHYHVKNMLKFWRDLSLERVETRMAMLLARIDQIDALASEAFFRSLQGKTTEYYDKQVDKARSKEFGKQLLDTIKEEQLHLKKTRNKKKKKKGEAQDLFDEYEQQRTMYEALDSLINADDGDILDKLIITQEKIKEYVRTEDNVAGDPRWLTIMLDCNKQRAQLWGIPQKQDLTQDGQLARLSDAERSSRIVAILTTAKTEREAQLGTLAPASPLGGFDKAPVPKDAGVVNLLARSKPNGFFANLKEDPDVEYDEDFDDEEE